MTEPGRPVDPNLSPQEQAQYLVSTGNGPTVDNESSILTDEFGAPDAHGVYGAPQNDEGGDAA